MNGLGSRFFGNSGGSLAAIASSGMTASTGGNACGSASATTSVGLCGLAGQMVPTVNFQSYTPSTSDGVATFCKSSHP